MSFALHAVFRAVHAVFSHTLDGAICEVGNKNKKYISKDRCRYVAYAANELDSLRAPPSDVLHRCSVLKLMLNYAAHLELPGAYFLRPSLVWSKGSPRGAREGPRGVKGAQGSPKWSPPMGVARSKA